MTFRAAFYVSIHSGFKAGMFNRMVRWLDRTDVSHMELVFSDGMSGSSSFMDNGVRLKRIEYAPTKWRFVDLPDELEEYARLFMEGHRGEKYDTGAVTWSVIGFIKTSINKWHCSESCMAALGFKENECFRFRPSTAEVVLRRMFNQ